MMWFYLLITFISICAYVVLILFILYQWQLPNKKLDESPLLTDINYSLLIPVRNEVDNIGKCLESIFANEDFDFTRLQVIVVDDYSEDGTVDLVKSIRHPSLILIELKDQKLGKINAYKKAAINYGLQNANGDYVIQLDGDVTVPSSYLKNVDLYLKAHNPDFVAAPVIFNGNSKFLDNFQTLDFLGMMLVTQAGINSSLWYMANGANMIYRNTLEKHDTNGMASGDDVYGIQSIAKRNDAKVLFNKSQKVTVTTQPEPSLKAFFRQRIRWGTKNKYMNNFMLLIISIPFLNSVLIPIHLFAFFIYGFNAFIILLIHLILKMLADYIFLKTAAESFDKLPSMKYFIRSSFFYIIYMNIVGMASLLTTRYTWKQRRVY